MNELLETEKVLYQVLYSDPYVQDRKVERLWDLFFDRSISQLSLTWFIMSNDRLVAFTLIYDHLNLFSYIFSPGFQRFVNVVCALDADERKAFVQFVTGCSSLPPGGLANLHPRLSVARKNDIQSSYPSVNTCYHYLKLPEYSSEEILRDRLLTATREKEFHFNWWIVYLIGICEREVLWNRNYWLLLAQCVEKNFTRNKKLFANGQMW